MCQNEFRLRGASSQRFALVDLVDHELEPFKDVLDQVAKRCHLLFGHGDRVLCLSREGGQERAGTILRFAIDKRELVAKRVTQPENTLLGEGPMHPTTIEPVFEERSDSVEVSTQIVPGVLDPRGDVRKALQALVQILDLGPRFGQIGDGVGELVQSWAAGLQVRLDVPEPLFDHSQAVFSFDTLRKVRDR